MVSVGGGGGARGREGVLRGSWGGGAKYFLLPFSIPGENRSLNDI